MSRFIRNLPSLSYQGHFLWKVTFVMLALGIASGFVVHWLSPTSPEALALGLASIDEESSPIFSEIRERSHGESKIGDFSYQLEDWVSATRFRMVNQTMFDEITTSNFSDSEKTIARLTLESLRDGNDPAPELTAMSEQAPPVQYSNLALGFFWRARDYPIHAARAFEKEATAYDGSLARELAVTLYQKERAYVDLIRLLDQPEFAPLLEDHQKYLQYKKAVYNQDWAQIFFTTVALQYTGLEWQLLLISMLTGGAWFAFLMHAGRLWKSAQDIALCGAAFLLGAMSTTATLLMITLQEEFLGFQEKDDLIGGLLYCVAGIGLREEFCKLLFFVPLLPFLMKRKSALLALIAAGCVGLGFAAEENISYFHGSMGFAGPGRFLTANFLHISATALTGYALYRVCAIGWSSLDYFASMFGMIVFAHGLYDAFIMVPALREYSIFSMTIYVLLCFQMFQIMDQTRTHTHQKISLSFVFTLALSIVLAVCLGYAVSRLGFTGVRLMGSEIVGVAVVVIMFFRGINEPIRI